ncbi:uncharacterized protein LOC6565467 isoform X2 [Drosophila grimshawi]|uniref:GH12573 n=3 Tax=Drosophila grimshawi TaxID=7222 RepID=B4JK13_DROGR|nr:uncharacterized protein LOC6565467 isoform X2 [Drosophila grimshawi]XP_032593872.1 uncharacterized protein LOC6565467 isoform X2 [Drosophila grimshawi]XP_032593873.1 uncharacterized protein LOC6565467 isoform X2 [Drosophila grimshawi]EDV99915.1 GH12573 [Drosophila grimshawi]
MTPQEKKVYGDTTQPLPRRDRGYYNRRDKSDLGEHFVAPDGGWAWLVCVAAGLSNLSLYPCLQQFGFLFRERLISLGMSSSQVTAIINTNPAVSACTGLLNGPMFRRFTFRQVAMAGSLLCFTGIALTAFCETFAGYIFAYAILYGFGMGISVSASSLAINTYFQQKRRRAAGFSWTITGLGPIFLPYLVTFLQSVYAVQGTVLIFAANSLHSFVSALIYQPVRYHVAPTLMQVEQQQQQQQQQLEPQAEILCVHCAQQQKREPGGIFSSQYLCQDDDAQRPGYEIIEPGTPMLSRANDGWYGSNLSLNRSTGRKRFRTVSSCKDLEHTQRLHSPIDEEDQQQDTEREFFRPNNFRREREESNLESRLGCTCAEQRALYASHQAALLERNKNDDTQMAETLAKMSFRQKLVTFFDLDLLRDVTFVNLVAGLTVINFGELNFSILTPFILTDFGFDTSQITVAMSLMAGMDITMRFLVPFITEKMTWDNRVFFLIGVVGIALGRTIVAGTRSFAVILSCFVWIGLCKGVRTIFWPLIIPGYVPLNRLPGASGLQLLISGLFTLICGPLVGLVRDRYNYSVTLHCLDALSFVAAALWCLEALLRRHRSKRIS